jgi:hypothetical protein
VGLRHCSEDLCRHLPSPGDFPQPEGCGSSLRRLEDPKVPGRLDPCGSSRRDSGRTLASPSAYSIGGFPPFVQRFEVSLEHGRNVDHQIGRDPTFHPQISRTTDDFSRSSPAREIKAAAREIKARQGLDSHCSSRICSPRLIRGDSEQVPKSREAFRPSREDRASGFGVRLADDPERVRLRSLLSRGFLIQAHVIRMAI